MSQGSQVSPRYDKDITSVPELFSYIEENNLSIKTLANAHKRIKDQIVGTYVNKCVAAVICNYSSSSLTFSRPSCLDNMVEGSVLLQCTVCYC